MKKLPAVLLALLLVLPLFGCAQAPVASTAALSETETVFQAEPQRSSQERYILNMSSSKFHLPDCSSVGQMAPQNKKEVVCTREELIGQGFIPCKRCNP